MNNKTFLALLLAALLSLTSTSYASGANYDAWDAIFSDDISYSYSSYSHSSVTVNNKKPSSTPYSYDAWDAIFSDSPVSPE